MIFTERTITIRNDSSSINAPVILYRGDKNVEVRFTLVESPYKYSNRDSINIIESTDASYAQLVIKTPNGRDPIFGDITAVGQSNVIFMIGYDMIDEIEEVGTYDFQIRLFDADQTSMATIPEVTGGFIIKEPIAKEDSNNNITNSAIVGSAVVTSDVSIPTFVGGSYNKTAWDNGTVISRQKLDKIEDGIYESYELSKNNSSQIKEKADKTTTNNIQQQVNNLVLGAVGDGNNAEVIQARGFYDLLNARLDVIQTGISNIINKKYNWEWVIGHADGKTGNVVKANNYRICTNDIIYSKDDILISLNDYSIYKYGVIEYSDKENTSRKDTGWLSRDYVIKKGTYFRITIAKKVEDEEITDRFFNKLLDNINICYIYEFKSVNDRIQALEKQYMSNNIYSLDYYPLMFGNINGNSGAIIANENRVITTNHIYLKKGCKIICNNNFLCGVAGYDDNYNYISRVEDIPTYTITKDGYYMLIFYKKRYAYETTDKLNEIKNNCFIIGENYVNDIYDLKYYGEEINLKPHAFRCEKLFSMNNTSSTKPPTGQGTQGMAISNNVLFQLWGNGFIELYDVLSGDFINAYNITSEHGDCVQFGNTKYAEDDEFPLLYITSDTTPAKIYINRVTRTSSELVKTLSFPSDKTGYYSGHAIDFEKNIAYQIGYKNNSYYTNNGTNKMIVSSWDLNQLTDNGDNTYTPEYIKSFELPFLITLQGQKFYDGKIYVVSSHWQNTNTIIYGIDIANQRICTIIKDLPSIIKNNETEDLEFWYDADEGDYKIILSVRGSYIYKLSFK